MKTRTLIGSLLFVSFFLVFVQANSPSLDSDGIHYASVAKEIARGGRWLFPFDPVINGPYYFHFPLSIWPTAFLFKFLGTSPAVAKLYSMLMTLAAVAGIFVLGRVLAGSWVGWFSGITFLFTNHVLRIARQCRIDLPAVAFLVWAFVGLILAQKGSRFWYLFMGAMCLAAIMTKEVVGLVPIVAAIVGFILLRKWKELFHPLFWTGVVYLALMPVLWWAAAEYNLFGDNLLSHYFRANFTHLLTSRELSTPWYYYGWAILDKYWYLLPFALSGAGIAGGKIWRKEEPLWIFVLLWAAAFPVGFIFAQHKIHYYILPTYAATALFVGLACDRWIRERVRPALVKGVMALTIVGAIALACFPMPLHKSRYDLNVQMAPRIDAILAQSPGELIVVRQDVASLLFYSKKATRITSAHHQSFQNLLAQRGTARRYCLIGHKDWELVHRRARSRWEILLDDGQRYFLREKGRG
jgi:4-amino-4-deoxy-L-arabinose transferase-like glycosyltransferase